MSDIMNSRSKIRVFFVAMVFVLTLLIGTYSIRPVHAADLNDRTVTISTSYNNEPVEHAFSFFKQFPSTVGSIEFEYCANSPVFDVPCVAPVNFDVSPFNISAQSGITGFSKSGVNTANQAIINRTPSLEPAVSTQISIDNFLNPDLPNVIVYVRIHVYDQIDGSYGGGTRVDEGAVVFVLEERFDLQAYVPPYMTFCVGTTVALDCSSTTGSLSDLGELSPLNASASTTQFSVATNDPDGYNVFVTGATMTSGSNTITPLPAQSASAPGTSQFGLNLRSNTAPTVGSNPQNGAVASGTPTPNYNSSNLFRFVSGDIIATANISTGFNRYTVSYLVNVPNSQPPGVYATTLTYTSIATF